METTKGFEIRKLGLYLSVSIFATLVDFSIFVLLLRVIGWHYLVSNVISRSLGITTKFSLNKLLTFKERNNLPWNRQFIRFLLVSGSAFLLSTIILYTAIEFIKLPEIYAKVFEIGFVFIYTFILHNVYSFN